MNDQGQSLAYLKMTNSFSHNYIDVFITIITTRASRLLCLPPQITRGRVRPLGRRSVRRQTGFISHHATRDVTLAGAVGTGNTVVRVLMRRTITSRGDIRRAGTVLSRRNGHDAAMGIGVTQEMYLWGNGEARRY